MSLNLNLYILKRNMKPITPVLCHWGRHVKRAKGTIEPQPHHGRIKIKEPRDNTRYFSAIQFWHRCDFYYGLILDPII